MTVMSTGRRLILSLATVAAAATVVPSAASAQSASACTFPRALTDAPVATQYELDLFTQQTQYDLARVSASTASAFTTLTLKRAASMTSAITAITASAITGTVAQPPTCP